LVTVVPKDVAKFITSDGYYAKFDTWGEAALHVVSPLAGNLYAK
jgi:hypothetical protein